MTYNERVSELAEKMALEHYPEYKQESDILQHATIEYFKPIAKVAIEFAKGVAETMYMQAKRDGIEISITKQEPKSIYQHLITLGLTE